MYAAYAAPDAEEAGDMWNFLGHVTPHKASGGQDHAHQVSGPGTQMFNYTRGGPRTTSWNYFSP